MPVNSLQEKILVQVKDLVLGQLEDINVRVYLFGSRAQGTAGHYSDVDIALLPFKELPLGTLGLVKEKLEESNIPYSVDVIDLSKADDVFRKKITLEGILWKDWKKE